VKGGESTFWKTRARLRQILPACGEVKPGGALCDFFMVMVCHRPGALSKDVSDSVL
jgi:hypothetical protein